MMVQVDYEKSKLGGLLKPRDLGLLFQNGVFICLVVFKALFLLN